MSGKILENKDITDDMVLMLSPLSVTEARKLLEENGYHTDFEIGCRIMIFVKKRAKELASGEEESEKSDPLESNVLLGPESRPAFSWKTPHASSSQKGPGTGKEEDESESLVLGQESAADRHEWMSLGNSNKVITVDDEMSASDHRATEKDTHEMDSDRRETLEDLEETQGRKRKGGEEEEWQVGNKKRKDREEEEDDDERPTQVDYAEREAMANKLPDSADDVITEEEEDESDVPSDEIFTEENGKEEDEKAGKEQMAGATDFSLKVSEEEDVSSEKRDRYSSEFHSFRSAKRTKTKDVGDEKFSEAPSQVVVTDKGMVRMYDISQAQATLVESSGSAVPEGEGEESEMSIEIEDLCHQEKGEEKGEEEKGEEKGEYDEMVKTQEDTFTMEDENQEEDFEERIVSGNGMVSSDSRSPEVPDALISSPPVRQRAKRKKVPHKKALKKKIVEKKKRKKTTRGWKRGMIDNRNALYVVPKNEKKLFEGFHFSVTGCKVENELAPPEEQVAFMVKVPNRKNDGHALVPLISWLEHTTRRLGGKEFDLLNWQDSRVFSKTLYQGKFPSVLVLSERKHRTAKWIMALALGVPCVRWAWLTDCVTNRVLLDIAPYLIEAGLDLRGRPVRRPKDFAGRAIFQELRVEVVGGKAYQDLWKKVFKARGAKTVQRLLSQDRPRLDVVVCEDSANCPNAYHRSKAARLGIPLVRHEWALQCLIENRLIAKTGFGFPEETATESSSAHESESGTG